MRRHISISCLTVSLPMSSQEIKTKLEEIKVRRFKNFVIIGRYTKLVSDQIRPIFYEIDYIGGKYLIKSFGNDTRISLVRKRNNSSFFRKAFLRNVLNEAESLRMVNQSYSWIVFSKETLLPSIDIPCNSERVN